MNLDFAQQLSPVQAFSLDNPKLNVLGLLIMEGMIHLVWNIVNASLSHFLVYQTFSKLTTSIRRRMVLLCNCPKLKFHDGLSDFIALNSYTSHCRPINHKNELFLPWTSFLHHCLHKENKNKVSCKWVPEQNQY